MAQSEDSRKPISLHSAPDPFQETPLDKNLREAFSKLIIPGMYVVKMKDDSMVPFIQKGALVFFREDHAVSSLVELVYRRERLIRMMVTGPEEHHWVYSPANMKYRVLYQTPKNCRDFQIIGIYCFSIHLGKAFLDFERDRAENVRAAGEIQKLLNISKFNRAGGEIDYEFGSE